MKKPGWRSKLADRLRIIPDVERVRSPNQLPPCWNIAKYLYKSESRKNPNYHAHFMYATLLHLEHQVTDTTTPGTLVEVQDEYEVSIGMNPNFAEAHLCLGNVYWHQARFLVNQDRESAPAQERLMTLIEKSRRVLEKARRLNPSLRERVEGELSELRELETSIHPTGLPPARLK